MLYDIVVDTNVFLHASNSEEERHEYAQEFVTRLQEAEIIFCVDEGFSDIESKNRSIIGGEYWRKLGAGTIGYEIVVHLARTERVRIVPRKVDERRGRIICRRIRDKSDRIFVKVAANSIEHRLVSHDFVDIPAVVRGRLRREIDVSVMDAEQILQEIA